MLILHDRQTITSYLGEDAQDSIFRIKNYQRDTKVKEVIFPPLKTSPNELGSTFQCSYCALNYNKLDDLLQHLESGHGQKMLSCHLCNNMFLNYGSFRSHICFGSVSGGDGGTSGGGSTPVPKSKFMCPQCQTDDLHSFIEFQRHIRQNHDICDVCFASVGSQENLSQHCHEEHNQELMCMKCFMTYANYQQFRKHLYYKHDNEHQECEKCHQKTWPSFVYHFCIEPRTNTCEVCEANFESFRKYRVHLRTHTGATPHVCSVRGCRKSYVSKQLLLKHHIRRHPDMRPVASAQLETRRNRKYLEKMGASSMENVLLCQSLILQDLIQEVIPYEKKIIQPEQEVATSSLQNPENLVNKKDVLEAGDAVSNRDGDGDNPVMDNDRKEPPEPEEEEFDPIAAAVASIMGTEGKFDLRKSPVKPVVTPTTSGLQPARHIPMPSLLPITSGSGAVPPKTQEPLSQREMLEAVKGGSSLLRAQRPFERRPSAQQQQEPSRPTNVDLQSSSSLPNVVDPLQEMMSNEKQYHQPIPEPSSILPPSTFHEIINGPSTKHSEEADQDENLDDKDKTTVKSANEQDKMEVEEDGDDDEKTKINPVLGGIWNQDLMFISSATENLDPSKSTTDQTDQPQQAKKTKGCKVMKPR